MQVSALLVSQNGARWLPAVVAGVDQQTHAPDQLIAVDTGSRDESVSILRRSGRWDVRQLAGVTSYADSRGTGANMPPSTVERP